MKQKWSQDHGTCNEKKESTPKPHYIPQNTLPLSSISYANFPLQQDYSYLQNYSLFFVTSDKGCITERSSSHHHTQSQKHHCHHHHYHHLHHPKKRTPHDAQVKVKAQNHQGETGDERCN